MKRSEILLELKNKIDTLNKLKKEYPSSDSVKIYLKDLKNVYKCIKKGGNFSDIQKVSKWNYAFYFSIYNPKRMSLKDYMEKVSDNVEYATGVEKILVYLDYINPENIIYV